MKNGGGPAFPSSNKVRLGDYETNGHPGMSLRDYFAAHALQGLIVRKLDDLSVVINGDMYANVAYSLADAMIAEREK